MSNGASDLGLLPGVIDLSESRESPHPRSIGDVYILGGRSNSKNMTIDGVTRGGAKQFHGSAGWYHRHESYAANDFFNNRNGRGTLADVSYVGSLSRHFAWQRNVSPVPVGARHLDLHPENRDPSVSGNRALPDNFLRAFEGLADVILDEFGATLNYN